MKRKPFGVIFLALGLIALGIVMVGVQVFGWDIRWFAGWWTILIAAAAVVSIVSQGVRYWNVYLLLFSVVTFAYCQNLVLTEWDQYATTLGAMALILLGISLIVNMLRPKKAYDVNYYENAGQATATQAGEAWQGAEEEWPANQPNTANTPFTSEDFPSRFALFSSESCRSNCRQLRGGRFSALFGGVTADLRAADFDRPVTVECNALFGGVNLYVPPHVRAECAGTSIFGGCSAKGLAGRPYDPAHPVLTVRYLNVFGGVNVK